ncbi:MAG: phosphoenolpyruvate-protein phosphotransferase system enzyme [Acidobacteriota bacterium]|nr:phosphoenolpyruvate-protein phosphotransferase system enzyme [Acidobacteriota bacterium]
MSRKRDKSERRWQGIAVSDGAAAGRVLRVHSGGRHSIYRVSIEATEVEREVRRYRAAVRLARRQLLALKKRAARTLGDEHSYIFDAHLLMLEDRKLNEDVEAVIRTEGVNSEWAVKVVTDRLLAVYEEIKDDYLRERSSDIEDVTRRLLVALTGESMRGRRLTEDAVIVAEELMPSTLAELDFTHIKAVATDVGGWTSHTSIIARGLGIPAVVGLRDFYRAARTGDSVVIEAGPGEVVLHPTPATLERFGADRRAAKEMPTRAVATAEDLRAPLRTRDGVGVTLRANVELPVEYEWVNRYGAHGIGLFRSEFLLSHRGVMPDEEEQRVAYEELARIAGDEGVTVRLFDLGGDKLSASRLDAVEERNPALGLRAIRFCLERPDVLRTQARAVLRAAARGRIDLVLPMVSDVTDVRRARAVIEEESARLATEGKETGRVRIGAMIEVPSAVWVADKLAREVDFFSLGTNDLVQYTLAVDRGNDEVAGWFRSLHPAVLQSIGRVLDAARAAGIPSVVCGEMAASPAYATVLLGLGARELSMAPSAIPRVRRTIAGLEHAEAESIAAACLACASAEEVEELVRERLGARWPNLFPPEILPPPKSKG